MSKEPSYVRCIKPNDYKQPSETATPLTYLTTDSYLPPPSPPSAGKFDESIVRHQVKYLGLMENLRVRRAGFCYRRVFPVFLQRYKCLCPATWPHWEGSDKEGVETLCRHLGYTDDQYKTGK